jgi:hypothetical protein
MRRNDTGKRAAYIHPVMKQYAARGIVDSSGSTLVMRKSLSSCRRGISHSGERDDEAEGIEDAGVGRASEASVAFFEAADMVQPTVLGIRSAKWASERAGARDQIRDSPRGGKCKGRGSRWEDEWKRGFKRNED